MKSAAASSLPGGNDFRSSTMASRWLTPIKVHRWGDGGKVGLALFPGVAFHAEIGNVQNGASVAVQ